MTRAEASRINGAKSKGPKTAEGKKRSSRNALKHGLASPFILIPQECPDDFRRLCDEYTRHFQPQNEVERDLVYEAVSCMWRILRIQSAESSLIEIEISRQRHEVDQKFTNPDDWIRLAMAFENLANNGRALALIGRYESRMMRAKDRAMEQLRKLRADPQPDDPEDDEPDENLPSEPEPAPEPGIEKMPNEPETAVENLEEPVQNQPATRTKRGPEPPPNEPDNPETVTTPDELQRPRCEHRRIDASPTSPPVAIPNIPAHRRVSGPGGQDDRASSRFKRAIAREPFQPAPHNVIVGLPGAFDCVSLSQRYRAACLV